MHYYSFNIGDYATATAHLEPLEDLAYRRLLDLYYSSEQPITEDLKQVARLIRMRTHSEFIATVLEEFFTLEKDGWHCDRVDVEIFKYNEKSYKASKSAKSRWKKAKQKQKVKASCEGNANALEAHSEGNANQEPLTNNQEPITVNQEPSLKDIQEKLTEDAFAYFWSNMKMRKSGDKKKALSYFKTGCGKLNPMDFAMNLVADTETRFNNQQYGFDKTLPTSYLNGKRWEDEYSIDRQQTKQQTISENNRASMNAFLAQGE